MAVTAELEQKQSQKSFDLLASVEMYSFDLATHGRVLPETKQRVYDEELTYIAEGINRPLYTEFVLKEKDGELVFFDRGKWVPYLSSLERSLAVATNEAEADPRKKFTAERAVDDLLTGYRMQALKPGEQMAWHSPFPEKESQIYGEEFIGSLGYQPKRKLGFIYHAEKLIDGSLVLQTQSVDGNDGDAFSNALKHGQHGIGVMREKYDQVMSHKYGGDYYAGREASGQISQENAWEIIKTHKDLLKYYFDEIELLAVNQDMPMLDMEKAKRRLTYGVWAALRERMDKAVTHRPVQPDFALGYNQNVLQAEVQNAYRELSKRGEVLFGCGGKITGEDALLGADSEQVFEAVFSGKNEVLKCVTCPLCKRSGVDAHIRHEAKQKTITCSKCKGSKTYAK